MNLLMNEVSIKPVKKSQIESQYEKFHDENNLFIIRQGDEPIAYLTFSMKEDYIMWLNMIEVVTKGKGIGTALIHFLFKHFSLKRIEGWVQCEEMAYRFWDKIGAKIYYISSEGYSIDELIDAGLESPFTLEMNNNIIEEFLSN